MNRNLPYLIKMVTQNLMYGFIIQFLFLTTLMAIDTKAQIKSIDQTYIRLAKKETPIKEVFSSLESATSYVFVYPDDVLTGKKNISIGGDRHSVYDILTTIAKDANLKFKQVKNSIFVVELRNGEAPGSIAVEKPLVEGKRKLNDEHGMAKPDATVLLEGRQTGTATDIDGSFSIDATE